MRDDGEEGGEREGEQREMGHGQIRVDELRKKMLWRDAPHSTAEISLQRRI